MDFLSVLTDQISSQFSLGENTDHTLDAVVDGQNVKYGSLGDFAQKFDQSAERRYVEEGYLRKDPYNTDTKRYEILVQEPNFTVFVKKKMFSSVGDNFRPDYMDRDEKLYYKAMQILFQNKCRQIAALEKLSKIQKAASVVGQIDAQLVPIIITLADTLTESSDTVFGGFGGSNPFSNTNVSNFAKIIDRLRRVYAFNNTSQYTSWITDPTNLFQSQFGQGTGVIEITNFTSINTNVSTSLHNPGSFSFTISDPYESMLITDYDIEKALSDATNSFYNHKSFQFGLQGIDQVINDAQSQLNQAREARKASPISFKVNPDTLLGKRVVAIIDRVGTELIFTYDSTGGTGFPGLGGAGNSVSVSDEYLKGGAVAGFDGLDASDNVRLGPDNNIRKLIPDSELSIFKRLVASIFNKLQLEANSRNAFQTTNRDTNYARRKLRFNFSGQVIIQPMDVVHIYANSKSRLDAKLLSGVNNMFTGAGILQNLNNTLVDFKNATDALFNPSGSVPLQIEKSVYVGADFPNFLWSLVRTQFVTEREGTHIFAGVVDQAFDDWVDGKFTIDVRGRDNTYYFEQGKVNFKPGVDNFNGAIFDPLTPFKSNFDDITSNFSNDVPELLLENQVLLGTSKTDSLVKFKLGPYAGDKVDGSNYVRDKSVDPVSGLITKVFYAPDGLVYKWKEGIGVFTQFGSSLSINDPNRVGNANTFAEPFAGLDIMNVISLLITGVPYNFANYFKVTQNLGGIGFDPQSKQEAAYSFANSLKNDLSKSNTLWGNFIPFKNLVMDEQSYVKMINSQFSVIRQNKDLEAKLQKLADLNRQAALYGAININSNSSATRDPVFLQISAEASSLKQAIESTITNMLSQDQSTITPEQVDNGFTDQFNDISGKRAQSDAALRRYLRRQYNYLTRRMSYEVRGNEDKNLFIVDDYYDKDYDIAAYNQALADGIKLYNNEFTSVKDKIGYVADLLNLEVFCDTQGHIRVRPPQYNRMPSSVFYRMMYLKQALGIRIFPQFLDDMFKTPLETLRNRIEIIEDQIRLDCAILGHKADINSDDDTTQFLTNNTGISGLGASFKFISGTDGLITSIGDLLNQANPDQTDDAQNTSFGAINAQASNKLSLSNVQRYTLAVQALADQNLDKAGLSTNNAATLQSSVVNDLINRIYTNSGQRVSPQDYIATNSALIKNLELPPNTQVDVLKVVNELSDKIQERQSALKLFYNTIKNAAEFKSLDDKDDKTGNELLTPGIFGNSHIPEIYEHMIEDESYDDYGIGSGKRYIIKRHQIKNIRIGANPPPFTAVEVQGILNPLAPNALPPGLNAFPSSGNGLVTAMAIDYDMWRNYGFREGSPIKVPFLSDPASQCAPFASMILSRNRKNILQGSLTISGNEFMQPGEVIFLEDRGMLFYVSRVSHNITMGSNFTTTLDLTYGHTPGEYIPTYMDVIGKLIYKNKDVADLIVQRQDSSGNDTNIGIVRRYKENATVSDIFSGPKTGGNLEIPPTNNSITTDTEQKISKLFQRPDIQTINNILYTSKYLINSNKSKGTNIQAKVELRLYYDNSLGEANSDLNDIANEIRNILIGNSDEIDSVLGKDKNPTLDPDSVEIVPINLDNQDDRRSPSQKALDAARTQISGEESTLSIDPFTGAPSIKPENNKIRRALFKYIVDCWLSITSTASNNTTGS